MCRRWRRPRRQVRVASSRSGMRLPSGCRRRARAWSRPQCPRGDRSPAAPGRGRAARRRPAAVAPCSGQASGPILSKWPPGGTGSPARCRTGRGGAAAAAAELGAVRPRHPPRYGGAHLQRQGQRPADPRGHRRQRLPAVRPSPRTRPSDRDHNLIRAPAQTRWLVEGIQPAGSRAVSSRSMRF
jgi:hypothetical protein